MVQKLFKFLLVITNASDFSRFIVREYVIIEEHAKDIYSY